MIKRNTALLAALSMLAAGAVFASEAHAGASASAASKHTNGVQVANSGQSDQVDITQFTSSSAPRHHHRHH